MKLTYKMANKCIKCIAGANLDIAHHILARKHIFK